MSEHQSSSAPTNGWACPTCGYMCWPGLTHSCPTGISVQMPLLTGSVLLDAQLAERDRELKRLRDLLFASHGCDGKYGDDVERQCNVHPPIDFVRDSIDEIETKSSLHGIYRFKHRQEQLRELASLRAELGKVIKLGERFGFDEFTPFSIDQVITHAEYLQKERARLLYETMTTIPVLAQRIKELESQLALYPFDAATMNLQIHNLSKEQNEWRTRALHFQNLLEDSRRENARLREALTDYWPHNESCNWDRSGPPCTCGLPEALSPAPAEEAK